MLNIGFSPKASGFYPFGDATALAIEGGGIAKRLFFMFLFQSPPQYISTEPVRASDRVGYDCEEGGRSIPLPTLSEAHIVCTLLSPSYASLHARTLAWCFASFGISDACSCCCFSFPMVFPLWHHICSYFFCGGV